MKRKIYILISLCIFILMLLLYKFDLVSNLDSIVYNFIVTIKSDKITSIMKFITFFGGTEFIISIVLILFILSIKFRKVPIVMNIVILIEVMLNNVVKVLVRRDRPKLINIIVEKGYSFPSGHTMASITLYGFLIYLILKSHLEVKYKYIFVYSLSLLVLLIMISRIYLGVHYFSDVLGGFSFALAFLLVSIDIIERKKIL